MSTLIDNVNRIYTDKEAIKQAIITKGVTVPSGTSLDEYAALIAKINTGVDTSDGVLDKNLMGIGQIGYAKGVKVEGNVPVANAGSIVSTGPYATKDGHTVVCSPYYNDNNKWVGVTVQYANILMQPSGESGVSIATGGSEMAEKIGLTADKIVSGNTILGVNGSVQSYDYPIIKTGLIADIGNVATGQKFVRGSAVAWQSASTSTVVNISIDETSADNFISSLNSKGYEYIAIFVSLTLHVNDRPGFRLGRGYGSGTTTAQYYYTSTQQFCSVFKRTITYGITTSGTSTPFYTVSKVLVEPQWIATYRYNPSSTPNGTEYGWGHGMSSLASSGASTTIVGGTPFTINRKTGVWGRIDKPELSIMRLVSKASSGTATAANDTLALYDDPSNMGAFVAIVGF